MSKKEELFNYIRDNFTVDNDGLKIIWNVLDWVLLQSMDTEDTIEAIMCLLDGIGLEREEIERIL